MQSPSVAASRVMFDSSSPCPWVCFAIRGTTCLRRGVESECLPCPFLSVLSFFSYPWVCFAIRGTICLLRGVESECLVSSGN